MFLFYFKVSVIQSFLISACDMVNSSKFLGSGKKWEISDPDYPKIDSEIFDILK